MKEFIFPKITKKSELGISMNTGFICRLFRKMKICCKERPIILYLNQSIFLISFLSIQPFFLLTLFCLHFFSADNVFSTSYLTSNIYFCITFYPDAHCYCFGQSIENLKTFVLNWYKW